MTLPYKVALALATLALLASVWSRVTRDAPATDEAPLAAREAPALFDKGDPTAESGETPADPEEATAERSAEDAALAEAGMDADANAADADAASGPITIPLRGDVTLNPAPGPAVVTVDATPPPTLTVGRDPFALPVRLRATGVGSDPEEEGSTDGTDTLADAAPGTADAATPATPTRVYVVVAGDTFEGIAKVQLGSGTRWVDLAQANPLVDPLKLRIGQRLRLPVIEDPAPDALSDADGDTPGAPPTDEALPSPPPGVTHVVRTGESLSTIATRYYGDSSRWNAIYAANRERVGRNPHAVKVGMELVIPPAVPATPQQSASR